MWQNPRFCFKKPRGSTPLWSGASSGAVADVGGARPFRSEHGWPLPGHVQLGARMAQTRVAEMVSGPGHSPIQVRFGIFPGLFCWFFFILRCEQKAFARWWCHLASLVGPEQRAMSSEALISASQQFMEQSTLGDFSVRLRLLKAFHCQAACAEESKTQSKIRFW